jgi:osmotically-inducible protein OsmY
MKKLSFKGMILFLGLCSGLGINACKSKSKDANTTTTTITADSSNAYNNTTPAEVSPDAQLTQGVKDATKDYPGVDATVNNGEVTLTGTIDRERLTKLMQTIQSLHPKKVHNNLTIK